MQVNSEPDGEDRAVAGRRQWSASLLSKAGDARAQPVASREQCRIVELRQQLGGGDHGRAGYRIAAIGACPDDLAAAQLDEDGILAEHRRHRDAAADHFADGREIGVEPELMRREPVDDSEAHEHLIGDDESARAALAAR